MDCTLPLIFVLGVIVASGHATTVSVARVHASGTSIYIPVERNWLQEMALDVFNQWGGPQLSLPDHAVFQNQPPGTHPILLDISNVSFTEFTEEEPWDVERYTGLEVTLSIPFLSATPGGPARHSLGMLVLHEDRLDFPHSDFLYDYYPVSDISLTIKGLVVSDGGATIRIDIPLTVGCDGNGGEEAGADDDATYAFSLRGGEADFGFCRSLYRPHSAYCDTAWQIEYDLYQSSPNVCSSWSSENESYCPSDGTVVGVTGWFQDVLPVQPYTAAVAAEQYSGDYEVSAKYPCVEE